MVENMTVEKAEHLARVLERALDIAFEMIDPDGNFATHKDEIIHQAEEEIDKEEMDDKADTIIKTIENLKSENATLRERMEGALELPCKIGDEVCRFIRYADDTVQVKSSTIKSITINSKGIRVGFKDTFYSGYVGDNFYFISCDGMLKDKFVFTDTYYICPREVAEAHLMELRWEEE